MDTIFTVKNEDLARLSPLEAVDFFRELLWAEATTLGIGKNLINVPSAITVADGGIDAEIQNVRMNGGQGIIKKGLTRYQIKTGEFSLSRDVYVKKFCSRMDPLKLGQELSPVLTKVEHWSSCYLVGIIQKLKITNLSISLMKN